MVADSFGFVTIREIVIAPIIADTATNARCVAVSWFVRR
jgi:hypothetical protein